MNNILARFSVFAIACFSFSNATFAQSATPKPTGKTMFTGHAKSAEVAAKEVVDIVVGSFTKLGSPDPEATGETFYDDAEMNVINAIKGTLSGKLSACYSVQSMTDEGDETPPTIGVHYIMFIRKLGSIKYEIKKLLPASDANIAPIKAHLAARGQPLN